MSQMWDEDTGSWVPMGARPRYESQDARAARWVVRLLATSVFVAVVGVVFVVTVLASRDDDRSPSPRAAGESPVTTVVRPLSGIGPAPASRVDDYIAVRAEALRSLPPTDTAPRTALVSLRTYSPEADARKAVGPAKVVGFLVAVPGGGPTVVTQSLASWSEQQRRADIEERDAIAALIPTSGNDPGFQACYRKEVARLDKAIAAASPTAPVVFAVAVEAAPEDLRRLAADAAVRMVDIGTAVAGTGDPSPDPSPQWRGLRPEETATAGEPVLRPLDSEEC